MVKVSALSTFERHWVGVEEWALCADEHRV